MGQVDTQVPKKHRGTCEYEESYEFPLECPQPRVLLPSADKRRQPGRIGTGQLSVELPVGSWEFSQSWATSGSGLVPQLAVGLSI